MRFHVSLLPFALLACPSHPAAPGDTRTCEQRRAELIKVLRELPEQSLAAPIATPLPGATLSGVFHRGLILELDESKASQGQTLRLDQQAISGATREELIANLRTQLEQLQAKGSSRLLNLAVAPETDVRTLQAYLSAVPAGLPLEILFVAPPPPTAKGDTEAQPESRLLTSSSRKAQLGAAQLGYQKYSDCEQVKQIAETAGVDQTSRWPRLKHGMLGAIPQCKCEDLDADGLRNLLVAEQRAGNVALGAVPGSFLRDVRCAASMPLRSIQQVLDDVDKFDAEFSGNWSSDSLQFEQVITNDRLLAELCGAMPGEVLESMQRSAATLYFRVAGSAQCQAWRFQPLSPGSPMGIWEREGGKKLAFHYRVAGNEVRLFGPVEGSEPSQDALEAAQATVDDERYPCDQNIKLNSVSDSALQIESGGHWYFTQQACRAAPPDATVAGCVAKFATY
jgi:hypothetical protein